MMDDDSDDMENAVDNGDDDDCISSEPIDATNNFCQPLAQIA